MITVNKFEINKDVRDILNQLHINGYEAYIVGGCVRDMILGHEPHDFDITTSAEPFEVKAIFERTIDTGLQHGTVTVIREGVGYEVTTYRVDGTYLDNRRPSSVSFTKSLEEDLKRRDFTINAMAYCDKVGVVDLYGGMKDLEEGIVRCVGEPKERFTEDALRMLRAIRFAARFAFVIEEATVVAIKELSHLINKISAERIHMELTKTLCSKHPEYMERLVEYNLINHIMPEFEPNIGLIQNNPYHVYSVDQHTYKALGHIGSDEALRWTIYLHDIGKGYTKTTDDKGIDHFYGHQKVSALLSKDILNRLKFDNKTKDRILKLIDLHDYRYNANKQSTRKAMAKIGPNLFEDYIAVQRADMKAQAPDKLEVRAIDLDEKLMLYKEVLILGQCIQIKDLDIKGNDIMDLGIQRGEAIGIILGQLLEMVIEEPKMNEKNILLEKAKKLIE